MAYYLQILVLVLVVPDALVYLGVPIVQVSMEFEFKISDDRRISSIFG